MIDLPISPVLVWFLIGIAFYGIELALPGFVVFFFGIGAWCTALCVYIFDVSLATQLVLFLTTSVLSLLVLRSYLQNVFLGGAKEEEDSLNLNSAPSNGTVTEEIIPPAEGKVKYAGSFWRASAEEYIAVGTVVRIVEQHDLLVKVCPITQQGEE
ncbi:NfeD family protein [Desulfogranum marinum]|jgi:membrane protein implicated in regulation of membrane protease activity|uniref:NfeD family protein n=1 Tax=Desulfogranum marinum TaxID=453220 RepID=UPI001965CCBC|nr:NfeD family protein [Desulfogranum marinum]MBM9513045.1 NfeD family protein [Desulfogranum marinum]